MTSTSAISNIDLKHWARLFIIDQIKANEHLIDYNNGTFHEKFFANRLKILSQTFDES